MKLFDILNEDVINTDGFGFYRFPVENSDKKAYGAGIGEVIRFYVPLISDRVNGEKVWSNQASVNKIEHNVKKAYEIVKNFKNNNYDYNLVLTEKESVLKAISLAILYFYFKQKQALQKTNTEEEQTSKDSNINFIKSCFNALKDSGKNATFVYNSNSKEKNSQPEEDTEVEQPENKNTKPDNKKKETLNKVLGNTEGTDKEKERLISLSAKDFEKDMKAFLDKDLTLSDIDKRAEIIKLNKNL